MNDLVEVCLARISSLPETMDEVDLYLFPDIFVKVSPERFSIVSQSIILPTKAGMTLLPWF